jgi:hypothetical protein
VRIEEDEEDEEDVQGPTSREGIADGLSKNRESSV